jgi:cyanophycinase
LNVDPRRTAPEASESGGRVLLIGASSTADPALLNEMLERFVESSGGSQGRLVVLPAAASDPMVTGRALARDLLIRGAGMVSVLHLAERAHAEDERAALMVDVATGVLLAGDDCTRLVALLTGTPVLQMIRQRNREGAVIAALGASAMALGTSRFLAGHQHDHARDVAGGLAVLPHCVIAHGAEPSLRMLATDQRLLGIALDEHCAAVFESDDVVVAYGQGTLRLFDGRRHRSSGASVEGVRAASIHGGEGFDLIRGEKTPPTKVRSTSEPRAGLLPGHLLVPSGRPQLAIDGGGFEGPLPFPLLSDPGMPTMNSG